MASKIAVRPRPQMAKMMRALRGLSCSVTLRPSSPISPASIPLDHQLEIGWRFYVTQFNATHVQDGPLSPLRSARWIPGISFRFTFTAKPPPIADQACVGFLKSPLNPTLQSLNFTVERFHFRNTVFYQRVALSGRRGPWPVDHAYTQLKEHFAVSHVWKKITIVGSPRLYIPPHTPQFGIHYADFYDDAKRSNLKTLLNEPVYFGATGSLTPARGATNLRPAVQRRSVCQRWGHSAAICRSLTPRCAACAGQHDERHHSITAPNAPEECYNCKGPHRPDAKDCPFYSHRRDPEWIRNHQPSLRNLPSIAERKKGKKKAT